MIYWRLCACFASALLALGCDPYKDYKLKGEFNAGSVDPSNFPPPYRGAGATRNIAGSGRGFSAVRAYVDGRTLEYYLFPYGSSQVVMAGYVYSYTSESAFYGAQRANALRIRPPPSAARPLPNAYLFDPQGTGSPFPDQQQCRAPDGYSYDQRRDDVHYDEQGSIFTSLPEANFGAGSRPTWTYVPIVQEVAVQSAGEPCQDIKSEKTLLARSDVNVPRDDGGNPARDGRYLAWALIDPGSGVYHVGESTSRPGVGIQRWGWFNRFLVAYIDGGYIPTLTSGTEFVPQNLYIPSTIILTQADGGTQFAAGSVGAGYDVLEFARSDPRYSPICRVQIYDTDANPPTVQNLPKSAADARALTPISNPTPPPPNQIAGGDVIPPFVFCLQAQ